MTMCVYINFYLSVVAAFLKMYIKIKFYFHNKLDNKYNANIQYKLKSYTVSHIANKGHTASPGYSKEYGNCCLIWNVTLPW